MSPSGALPLTRATMSNNSDAEEQEKTDKKSKKRKKDLHNQEDSNTVGLVANETVRRKSNSESEGQILEIKQKKKSKHKRINTGPESTRSAEKTHLDADLVQKSGENSETTTLSEISKHKKKRKRVEPAGDAESSRKTKHREKPTLDEVVVAETSVHHAASDVADDGASRKKRKKRKHEEADEAHMETSEKSEPSPSHKKKKTRVTQKRSEFPDPSEDTALPESARNALVYVYARVTSSKDWKFNKARQNWVLRNIWDDAAIPETYIPSCVKYLAEVQGNTRKLLIASSRKLIEPPSEQEAATTATSAATAQPEVKKIDATDVPEEQQRKEALKVARARTLLSVLEEAMESAS